MCGMLPPPHASAGRPRNTPGLLLSLGAPALPASLGPLPSASASRPAHGDRYLSTCPATLEQDQCRGALRW